LKQLTEEQLFIIQQEVKQQQRFKITAFAGTGKTSTLISYALNRPNKQFLYLAFNKSMQLQAAKRFPSNVVCKTIHSLAWMRNGHQFKDKIGSLKPYHIFDFLDLPNLIEARFVLDTILNFIFSEDKKIKKKHIPFIKKIKLDYVDLAKRVWNAMLDPMNKAIPMEHDGYLKLFQIENEQLPYDIILLDEAQDSNPVTLGILKNQKCPVIMVGDSHQQLYSFRGAINAMDEFEAELQANLTGSFRFDHNIANLATALVSQFKDEDRLLRGLGGPSKIGKTGQRFALLSRTNAGLFDLAVEWHKTKKIHYLGGVDQIKPEMILDIWKIWHGDAKMVQDSFLKRFRHFSELNEYAKDTEDRELQSRISIVEKYRYEIPMLVNKIRMRAIDIPKEADVLFTTVHKAKGLEFNEVKLHSDFTELTVDQTLKDPSKIEPEEINILYVAVTRAKKKLELNEDLEFFKKLMPKPSE